MKTTDEQLDASYAQSIFETRLKVLIIGVEVVGIKHTAILSTLEDMVDIVKRTQENRQSIRFTLEKESRRRGSDDNS